MRAPFLASLALPGALALACGGNSGGGGETVQPSAAQARKLSGMGDSIMQGFDASCGSSPFCAEQPQFSFAQGTDASVDSLFTRYQAVSGLPGGKQFASETGATMIGTPSGPTDLGDALGQANAICAQAEKPNRIVVLLGGNDVCNAASVGALPSAGEFQSALDAALERLAAPDCGLPAGTWVHVLSMPRVNLLRQAGLALDATQCQLVWSFTGLCAVVTLETSVTILGQIQDQVDAYNEAVAAEVAAADGRHGGLAGIHFTNDWRGAAPNSSVGTFAFGAGDVSVTDCFHPSAQGQRKLACAAWESWEGSGDLSHCFQ